MGQATDQKVKEIRATRERIERDLQEIEMRMPPVFRSGKRLAGMVIGGGVVGSALLGMLKRSRTKRQERSRRAEVIVRVIQEPDTQPRIVVD